MLNNGIVLIRRNYTFILNGITHMKLKYELIKRSDTCVNILRRIRTLDSFSIVANQLNGDISNRTVTFSHEKRIYNTMNSKECDHQKYIVTYDFLYKNEDDYIE